MRWRLSELLEIDCRMGTSQNCKYQNSSVGMALEIKKKDMVKLQSEDRIEIDCAQCSVEGHLCQVTLAILLISSFNDGQNASEGQWV